MPLVTKSRAQKQSMLLVCGMVVIININIYNKIIDFIKKLIKANLNQPQFLKIGPFRIYITIFQNENGRQKIYA